MDGRGWRPGTPDGPRRWWPGRRPRGVGRRGSAPPQPRRNESSRRTKRGGSSAPHSSRAECIESWATPTSTVAMPSRAAVSGPIVDAARLVVAGHEHLVGHPGAPGRLDRHRDRLGVAGVALVGVHLDHRPAVDGDVVVGLVAVGPVGVGGVGAVGRHADRPGHRPEERRPVAATGRHDLFEDRRQQRAVGPGGRGGADLLVVEQAQHRGRRRGSDRGRPSRPAPIGAGPRPTTAGCRSGGGDQGAVAPDTRVGRGGRGP